VHENLQERTAERANPLQSTRAEVMMKMMMMMKVWPVVMMMKGWHVMLARLYKHHKMDEVIFWFSRVHENMLWRKACVWVILYQSNAEVMMTMTRMKVWPDLWLLASYINPTSNERNSSNPPHSRSTSSGQRVTHTQWWEPSVHALDSRCTGISSRCRSVFRLV